MSGVVIVGAGPAGVATASLLARNGIDVARSSAPATSPTPFAATA